MFHLKTPRTTAGRRARRVGRVLADAVRSVVTPATLVKAKATTTKPVAPVAAPTEPTTAPDPEAAAGIYTEADIERSCLAYDLAMDAARAADRSKRKHKKLLDRLPSGRYGNWLVERVASNRQVVDMEALRRIFEQHPELGPIPMRTPAPSLVVKPAPAPAEAAPVADEDRELVTA